MALFGANGSGKTTLLKVLATLIRPSAGTGTVLGSQLGTVDVDDRRPSIGLVGHEPALYPNLTLRENLGLTAHLRGLTHEAVDTVLELVGLTGAADRRAGRSSNGMRRRTEFARMAMTRPQLLLLDEAHVGLDREAWSLVAHLIHQTTERGGASIVVAHEESLVAPLVDHAARLVDGSLEVAS